MNSTGREMWRWSQIGVRAPTHGPKGGLADRLDEAKATFDAASVTYEKAKKDLERQEALHGQQSTTDAQLEVARDLDASQAAVDKLLKDYPDTDSAPMAHVVAGRIATTKGRTPADLDAALASFERVPRLFPGNEAVAAAGYFAGETLRAARRDADALERYRRVTMEYPHSVWAARASVSAGYCLVQLEKASQALQEFQRARQLLPGSSVATDALNYANSNYQILENRKSIVGEWNAVLSDRMSNNMIVGYTYQDESRGDRGQKPLFPFVVIGDGVGGAYTTFGNEPFTPYNLLRYNTFQLQDSVTRFYKNHSLTFGGQVEKFHSFNSFYFGVQSAYSYNSLADFYTDAQGYVANPNRTTSPVSLPIFQVRYLLQPGQTTPPLQELDVLYSGGYIQDEWRPRSNLTVTAGVRVDSPKFGNTAFPNPAADALTFRNQDGSAVRYSTGALPGTKPYWSPRVGINWDVNGKQQTQVRGGTGVFTGKPPYVWISNQIGNTGVLSGFLDVRNTTSFPFTPNPDKYKPAPTGLPATSYEVDVTDQNFRFPSTWRNNVGVDQKLPWGLIGTLDWIYNRDINAPVYLNANLPAAQTAYTGVDNRPRWATNAAYPACATAGQVGPCVTRLNNAPGNQITAAYVIKSQSQNRSYNLSGSLSKTLQNGCAAKAGYNYGVSKSLVEPSSTAGSSWGSANPIVYDPNNPALAYSQNSPGHRFFLQTSYSKRYLGFGATTVSLYYENRTIGNTSYIFSGDANGDTVQGNDLIYIPRNTSEMNFATFTTAGRTYTAADQAAAFEAYISQDPYLSKHRGQYAERNAVFLPSVNRMDLSLTQDVFKSLSGRRHSGQVRLDVTNFGNLLNHNWGAGKRLINNQILTNPTVDANGALSYRMQLSGGEFIKSSYQTNAGIADVYVMMLSFRYTFN